MLELAKLVEAAVNIPVWNLIWIVAPFWGYRFTRLYFDSWDRLSERHLQANQNLLDALVQIRAMQRDTLHAIHSTHESVIASLPCAERRSSASESEQTA